MKPNNILIVEDESIVALDIESYIHKLGDRVMAICSSANDALAVVADQKIDIVLMDIHIKGEQDGIETAIMIKKIAPHIEIIFLTAHTDDYHIDRAIEADPISYLSKPFNLQELRASIKIAQNRISQNIILNPEFSYDQNSMTLYCNSELVHLTNKESALLDLLIKNQNRVVDHYTIESEIWPNEKANTNAIRTLVKRVRQKLKYQLIETVASRGYVIEVPPQ